jgi:hypothetical protein
MVNLLMSNCLAISHELRGAIKVQKSSTDQRQQPTTNFQETRPESRELMTDWCIKVIRQIKKSY